MSTQRQLDRIWLTLVIIIALVVIVACSVRCWGW